MVTGAGRGIGRAIAIALAEIEASIALTARSRSELEETASLVDKSGGKALVLPGDVSIADQVREVVDAAERELSPIDLLVNNAGVSGDPSTSFWEEDPEQWWHRMEVNLRGPMLFSHAVLPGMVARNAGRIVNITSGAGNRPIPGNPSYGVSKTALTRLGECLALTLAGTGVSVFNLSPGLVRTAMTDGNPIFANVPADQWTPPERAGEIVVALASGQYDVLSGRFIHASDDLDSLLARADDIVEKRARILHMRGTDESDRVGN